MHTLYSPRVSFAGSGRAPRDLAHDIELLAFLMPNFHVHMCSPFMVILVFEIDRLNKHTPVRRPGRLRQTRVIEIS